MRTAQSPRWASPLIVSLGIAAALLEGAGMYLFIPLLRSLGADAGQGDHLGSWFDRLLEPLPEAAHVPVLAVALCLSILIKNLVGQANHFVARYLDGQVAHRLRTRVLSQTLVSCIDYRVDNRRSDIVDTIATNTWRVGALLSQFHQMLIAGCGILVFVLLLLVISPQLTLIAGVFLLGSALLVSLVSRHAQAVGQQVVQQNKAFGLRMWESIGGLRLIRSFSREAHELDRFEHASETLRRRILIMELLWSVPGPVAEVSAAVLIGVLIVAGNGLAIGVPALAAFLALLYRMQRPMRDLLSARVAFDSGFAAVEDVADFLDRTREPFIVSGEQPFHGLERGVEFRDVSYRYAEGEPLALDRLSLWIERGKTTAIVGRSGSGKSTLMDLLFRFRDPTEGSIRVDDAGLTELDIGSWRGRISIMSQQVHLLNDSVAANIGFGKPGATDQEIRRAATIAGAAGFIEALPRGYATLLGDEGMRLSGGQRQRIALARAILRDPELLLLDEATNALDTESQRVFQTALREYAQGRTVVVIAHHLSAVAEADLVVVLEAGRVVESGTPAALLARGGWFARLHGPSQPTGPTTES